MVLSDKATQIYEFIAEYKNRESIPPTLREIARGLEMSSTSLVAHYLDQLEAAGQIKRYPKIPRGIVLL